MSGSVPDTRQTYYNFASSCSSFPGNFAVFHATLVTRVGGGRCPPSRSPGRGSSHSCGKARPPKMKAGSLQAASNLTVPCRKKWKVKVTQLCPTLCDPMDCSLPGSSVCGILQARILEWVAFPFSPTQGSNPGLLRCRQIIYHLSYQGSPRILEWVRLSLLQRLFPTQESNRSLLHCRWILYQLS